MLASGPVYYEVGGNLDVTCFGGVAAAHRLVTRLGLPERIDAGLHLLKLHLPYHESDHVLNLAYNVLCGGTRLEDIEKLRHDSAYMNALGAELIPDPTTAGDFCRRERRRWTGRGWRSRAGDRGRTRRADLPGRRAMRCRGDGGTADGGPDGDHARCAGHRLTGITRVDKRR
jgi:hypothetical protein